MRCFVLDHDAALDEHVDAVHANLPATKENLDSEFSLDVQTALRECNLERATVDALHKAGPECVIDLVKRANDLAAQLRLNKFFAHGPVTQVTLSAHSGNSGNS